MTGHGARARRKQGGSLDRTSDVPVSGCCQPCELFAVTGSLTVCAHWRQRKPTVAPGGPHLGSMELALLTQAQERDRGGPSAEGAAAPGEALGKRLPLRSCLALRGGHPLSSSLNLQDGPLTQLSNSSPLEQALLFIARAE